MCQGNGKMSEDSKSIVKRILQDSSSELGYTNQEIIDILTEYVEDGTIVGLKSGRVKKMSDRILNNIRDLGEENED